MDTKRFYALEEIACSVLDDLEKVPMSCQNTSSFDQQRTFYFWLLTLTHYSSPDNITNYPIKYRGYVHLNPFILSNIKKWKYLIDIVHIIDV